MTITTRLVDTVSIPMLLKTVQSKRIGAKQLITHRFKLGQVLQAYDTFGKAADTGPCLHHRRRRSRRLAITQQNPPMVNLC